VYFTLTIGNDAPKYFVCRVGGLPLKIGRANNNDLMLNMSGVSGRHLEFKVPPLINGGPAQLALQDLSTNGIGITFSDNGPLIRLDKGVDMDVPADSFYLHLPFNVKPGQESRVVMKVDILTEADVKALADAPTSAGAFAAAPLPSLSGLGGGIKHVSALPAIAEAAPELEAKLPAPAYADASRLPKQVDGVHARSRDNALSASGGLSAKKKAQKFEALRLGSQDHVVSSSGSLSARKRPRDEKQVQLEKVEGARSGVEDGMLGTSEKRRRDEAPLALGSRGHRQRSRSHRRRRKDPPAEDADAKRTLGDQPSDKKTSNAAEEMMARCMQFALAKEKERETGKAGGAREPLPPVPESPPPPQPPAPPPPRPAEPLPARHEKAEVSREDSERRKSSRTSHDVPQRDSGRQRSPATRQDVPQRDSGRQKSPGTRQDAPQRDSGRQRSPGSRQEDPHKDSSRQRSPGTRHEAPHRDSGRQRSPGTTRHESSHKDSGRQRSPGTRHEAPHKESGRQRSPGTRHGAQKDSGRRRSPGRDQASKKTDEGSARGRLRAKGESLVDEARSLMKDELLRRAYGKYCEGVKCLMESLPEKDSDADDTHLRNIDTYLKEMEKLNMRIKGSPSSRS